MQYHPSMIDIDCIRGNGLCSTNTLLVFTLLLLPLMELPYDGIPLALWQLFQHHYDTINDHYPAAVLKNDVLTPDQAAFRQCVLDSATYRDYCNNSQPHRLNWYASEKKNQEEDCIIQQTAASYAWKQAIIDYAELCYRQCKLWDEYFLFFLAISSYYEEEASFNDRLKDTINTHFASHTAMTWSDIRAHTTPKERMIIIKLYADYLSMGPWLSTMFHLPIVLLQKHVFYTCNPNNYANIIEEHTGQNDKNYDTLHVERTGENDNAHFTVMMLQVIQQSFSVSSSLSNMLLINNNTAAPEPQHHDAAAAPEPQHHDAAAAPEPQHHDAAAAPEPQHHAVMEKSYIYHDKYKCFNNDYLPALSCTIM
jgi:hypothetical protein